MIIRSTMRVLGVSALALVALAAVLAEPFLRQSPGGDDGSGSYRDTSGHLGNRKGAAATWAESWGRIDAVDVNDAKSARGGIVDNKFCEGGIPEAQAPAWVWRLQGKMNVKSQAFRVVSSLQGTATGVLAHWGDGGGPFFDAAEATTTSNERPGDYNIEIVVDGNNETVDDGGTRYRPGGGTTGALGGNRDVEVSFTTRHAGATVRFTYESRASGSMELDFNAPANEHVAFEVRQTGTAWSGFAQAWDGPILLKVFILD